MGYAQLVIGPAGSGKVIPELYCFMLVVTVMDLPLLYTWMSWYG